MILEKMEKNYSIKFDQVVDGSSQQAILEGNDNEQPIIHIYVAKQNCATKDSCIYRG